MELHVRSYDHPDAIALIELLQQEYVARYGGIDQTPVEPDEFAPPSGLFLVGYVDGTAVSCGGWRRHEANGSVEIKRMYVAPPARGQGWARVLLAELERTIAAAGYRQVVLESGLKQPEALALYQSSGYAPIEPYGIHRCSEASRCFGKGLR